MMKNNQQALIELKIKIGGHLCKMKLSADHIYSIWTNQIQHIDFV